MVIFLTIYGLFILFTMAYFICKCWEDIKEDFSDFLYDGIPTIMIIIFFPFIFWILVWLFTRKNFRL